jgi:hypothetical protein
VLVPLYGFLRGDSIGLVVLVHDHQLVADIAATLQQAATVRVAPAARATVYYHGRRLDPALTVAAAGLQPLDRIDVVQEDGGAQQGDS